MSSNTNYVRQNINSKITATRVGRVPKGNCPGAWGGFSSDLSLNERYLSNWDRDTALRRFEKRDFPLNPRAKSFTPAMNPCAKASLPLVNSEAASLPLINPEAAVFTASSSEARDIPMNQRVEQLHNTPTTHTGQPKDETEKLLSTGVSLQGKHLGITAWKSFAKRAEETGFAATF
ncbi:hypothetical protein DFH27DRAFT_553100 [Peziza echinospora]|nr:hypothetical protein DFH27DRAFT_553100 [Peziza echinospora]